MKNQFKPFKLTFEGTRYFADSQGDVFKDETGEEVSTELARRIKTEAKRLRRNKARRMRDQVMRDCGLTKVRGNLGGTYWE
jgi:hypothetical protein